MTGLTYYFDTTPSHQLNVTASAKDVVDSPGNFFEAGDLSWMMTSSALVLIMIPGTGLLYSGMSRNSSLSMVWMPTATAVVVGFVWFLWGYAITFSPSSNGFWGGSDGIVFHNALIRPVGIPNGPKIPELLFALYQGMFACFTAGLVSGATIFKERTHKFMIFIVFWTTLVYCPIAHWSWNPQGWANKWGTYDFAGGTPVHICSGTSSLAYSLFYKFWIRRYNSQQQNKDNELPEENYTRTSGYDAVSVVTGTVLLWIGWFGFNGGSALGANLRAVSACVSTTVAACSGGITAFLLDSLYIYINKRLQEDDPASHPPQPEGQWLQNLVEAVSAGMVVGMVAVTPAAGYTPYYWAPMFGIIGELICYNVVQFSGKLFDPLSIFTIHGVAGFVGMILTGIFARSDVAALDGYTKNHGGCNMHDKNCSQLYKQLVDALAGFVYSFVGTLIILCIMELTEMTWRRVRGLDRPKPKLVVDLGGR